MKCSSCKTPTQHTDRKATPVKFAMRQKTYLVTWHGPEDDADTWPHHTRVSASTVTRAIKQFHRETVARWNDNIEGEVYRPNDFPVMEVKVVA